MKKAPENRGASLKTGLVAHITRWYRVEWPLRPFPRKRVP